MSSAHSSRGDISRRANALVGAPSLPAYLTAHFERAAESYDAGARPDGYIALCIAENKLMWDVLEPMLNRDRGVPPSALGYDDMTGSRRFREALAGFLSERVLGRQVEADDVMAVAGAGSVLESLFWTLADPGEGVLVPTPSYAGFWMDLELRDALTLVPVPGCEADGYRVSIDDLEAALQASPVPIRVLLFTSPSNPLGTVYTRDELEAVLSWAEGHGLHVVFDEVYALSVHHDQPFVSAASLRDRLGDHTHIIWAFSKDFAASGLRCGVLVSENEGVRMGVNALAVWSCVSGDTQHLLGQWVSDDAFVDRYVSAMQQRLGAAYRAVTARLDAAGVPYVPGGAGFFVVVDLRQWLAEPTWDAEDALWRRLLAEANVNLTPGSAMRCEQPGLFRLCFAGVAAGTLEVAMRRLVSVLGSGNQPLPIV